jgi:alpha-tubulin suppressor-like RCC1 family protein
MVKATNWFSRYNEVKDGAISIEKTESFGSNVDFGFSPSFEVLATQLYYYESIPIVYKGANSIGFKQYLRNEVVDNAHVIDTGIALFNDSIYTWGLNDDGELGNNTTTSSSSPISVVTGLKFTQVLSKNNYVDTSTPETNFRAGLTTNGFVWTWGKNDFGQLGDGTVVSRSLPVSVIGNKQFVTFGTGDSESITAIDASGFLWGWGRNDSGQLGDGTTINKSFPVLINDTNIFIATKGNIGIDANNFVWSWGKNTYGQLGNGTTYDSSVPVLMSKVNLIVEVSKGMDFAVMLRRDGKCFTVGRNNYGQLGDNSAVDKSIPVLLNTKYTQIASGAMHTLALDSNGIIWSWGNNSFGQLGNGTTENKSNPTNILSSKRFVQIGASGTTSIAVDVNGYVWCWGRNVSGSLGNNTITDSSIPVSIIGGYQGRTKKIY